MSTGLNNIVPIKVKFYSKSGVLGETEFESNETFGTILKYFNYNLKSKYLRLKDEYIIDGKKIEDNEKAINLIEAQEGFDLTKGELWIEVDETEKIDDENEPVMEKILKPKKDPFGIFVFTPSKGSVTLEEYNEKISEYFGVYKFNYTCAYCNSPKALYISGGIYFGEPSNEFWIIDHRNYRITKKEMPENKSNHSMLYLPDDKILIAGGDDVNSFYYDIKEGNFHYYSDMNGIHPSPALVKMNNFVFCLNSLVNDQEFFEKIDLSSEKPSWIKIYPRYKDDKASKFDNKLFGASKSTNGNIIIAGGSDIGFRTFLFNTENNLLSLSDGYDRKIDLSDKTFYKIDKTHSVAIPQNFERTHEIAVINKLKKSLRTFRLKFNNNIRGGTSLKKEKEGEKRRTRNIGNVSVKGKFNQNEESFRYTEQFKEGKNRKTLSEGKVRLTEAEPKERFTMTSMQSEGGRERVTIHSANREVKTLIENEDSPTIRHSRLIPNKKYKIPIDLNKEKREKQANPQINYNKGIIDDEKEKNTFMEMTVPKCNRINPFKMEDNKEKIIDYSPSKERNIVMNEEKNKYFSIRRPQVFDTYEEVVVNIGEKNNIQDSIDRIPFGSSGKKYQSIKATEFQPYKKSFGRKENFEDNNYRLVDKERKLPSTIPPYIHSERLTNRISSLDKDKLEINYDSYYPNCSELNVCYFLPEKKEDEERNTTFKATKKPIPQNNFIVESNWSSKYKSNTERLPEKTRSISMTTKNTIVRKYMEVEREMPIVQKEVSYQWKRVNN